MVIIGAAMNHWYHMDMNYRGVINLLVMCGCVGQSGGGWAHYVGQEKLRPQTGWTALAFALDWARPPRHMNSTSAWYAHTDQWRYETLRAEEILSPTAPDGDYKDLSLIDYNIRAERMGWLPSAPQLKTNPLEVGRAAKLADKPVAQYVAEQLKSGELQMSCEDPDAPENWPRNLFVWRSNLLGSSGKGHEYFLKHLLGTDHGVLGRDLGEEGRQKPAEAVWHDQAPEGKLDLLVCIDFRMSTTAVYADIVLPTASWYEKDDLNTSDMHPFIHPLQAAVDPAYESKTDWEIFKAIARKFSRSGPRDPRGRDGRGGPAAAPRHGERACPAAGPRLEEGRMRPRSRARPRRTTSPSSATTRTSTTASPRSARSWRRSATAARASPGTPRPRCTTSRP
jgi:nitrate reductase / nitrite oxidoreductase, alpha subunit